MPVQWNRRRSLMKIDATKLQKNSTHARRIRLFRARVCIEGNISYFGSIRTIRDATMSTNQIFPSGPNVKLESDPGGSPVSSVRT